MAAQGNPGVAGAWNKGESDIQTVNVAAESMVYRAQTQDPQRPLHALAPFIVRGLYSHVGPD